MECDLMRIGMFSDPHYSSAEVTCGNRYNSRSLEKIRRAMTFFAENQCDMVIILGDVTDTEPTKEMEIKNLREIAHVLKCNGTRTVCLMGNHDAFVLTPGEFYEHIGVEFCPETITAGQVNLVFLDACYYRSGEHYAPGGSDWTDTFYPHTAQLEKTLDKLTGDTYIFMHQNIDPNIREDHRLFNDAEMRRILEESGKVRGVFQGHYHWGMESEVNGIKYVTLKAMCENDDAQYIFEI